MTKGIKCIAPIFDLSGYGSWSRTYIQSLIQSNLPITIGCDISNPGKPISYDPARVDFGPLYSELSSKINLPIEYDTVITWLTPECAVQQNLREAGKKKILMTLWETSSIPDNWVPMLDIFDEIWLPGQWNVDIFKSSIKKFSDTYTGFKSLNDKPIRVLEYPVINKAIEPELENLVNIPENNYVFYFISQWSERKNFTDLIYTYITTFKKSDPVSLVLKTHLRDFSQEDRNFIINEIQTLCRSSGLTDLPDIILLHGSLSSKEISSLHTRADCYLSCSRGEGLGLGMLEAALHGNPVITNSYGEQSMYFKHNLLNYNHILGPVKSNFSLYKGNQNWAYPDFEDLRSKMQFAVNNKDYVKQRALGLKDQIISEYGADKIKDKLLGYLK